MAGKERAAANASKAPRRAKSKPAVVEPSPEPIVDDVAEEADSSQDSEEEDENDEELTQHTLDTNRLDESVEDTEEDSDEEGRAIESLDELDEEADGEEIRARIRTRQTINNKQGLLNVLRRFELDTSGKVPFSWHQTVVASEPTEASIEDVHDDLNRELAFLRQSLEAARVARSKLVAEKVPFTRPTDYFAEMLRSDATMDKVKAKMVEEASAKKASAEARKLRDLKKFGKQVQTAKLQERAKQKRETLEKIQSLKRKRQENLSALGANEADDLFDVAVDNELGNGKSGGKKRSSTSEHGGANAKRQKKNEKFGFGGKKRNIKSGDAVSSGDISGFNTKRMKTNSFAGGSKKFTKPRLGKARRKAGAGKR